MRLVPPSLAAVLLALEACCPPTPPKSCHASSDCSSGQMCIGSYCTGLRCRPDCTTDENGNTTCSAAGPCASGYSCGSIGFCEVSNPPFQLGSACSSDQDCTVAETYCQAKCGTPPSGEGGSCSFTGTTCVPGCDTDAACGAGAVCSEGACYLVGGSGDYCDREGGCDGGTCKRNGLCS